MIKKFENYIAEFYSGPYSSAGFKTEEPKHEYELNVDIKFDSKNRKRIKDILTKYNVPYNELTLNKEAEDSQNLYIKFLSYNKFEASSIIDMVLTNLDKNDILFNPKSIQVSPLKELSLGNRKPVVGFK